MTVMKLQKLSAIMMKSWSKSFQKGNKDICISATTTCYHIFSKILTKTSESLEQAVETKKNMYLKDFVSMASIMPLVGDILFGALNDDPDCLYYKDINHEDWDLFFSAYDYEQPKKLKPFMNQYQRI